MRPPEFSAATLVLLGHGTTLDAQSSAPVFQHAAEIRQRKVFAEVREAFWKQDPQVKDVLAGVKSLRVFIVPLFISEGYFSEEAIPLDLGFREEGQGEYSRMQQWGEQKLFYTRPVGTHDRMTEVLLTRAREIVAKFPFPRSPDPKATTLFIVGHGTEKNENSRRAIERHVELIRGLNLYVAVHAVFLEEAPRIGECYQIAQTKSIIVVPFFISDGLHVRQDIPVLLGETARQVRQRLEKGQPTWRNPTERKGKRVWYSASVGTEPLVADIILERVKEAAQGEAAG